MRAAQIVTEAGPDAVAVNEVDVPAPAADQVLIKVHATGVSFPELLQSRGEYQFKPPMPFTPGSEVAGEVVSAPEGSGFVPGDRVAAMVLIGGWSEYAVAPVSGTFALPDRLSFAQGAALPLNYLTAHFALTMRAHLQPGESVLVHGAAGGVGTASIQTAKALGAGTVIAVASTPQKQQVALDAGADVAIAADGFLASVQAMDALAGDDGHRGVDVVVDPVGGDRFTDSLRSLKPNGRLLVIGFTGGEIPTVKVNRLLLGNTSVVGVGWGHYVIPRPAYLQEQWTALLPAIESGIIDPPVGATFGLDEAPAALHLIDSRGATGKVLLTP